MGGNKLGMSKADGVQAHYKIDFFLGGACIALKNGGSVCAKQIGGQTQTSTHTPSTADRPTDVCCQTGQARFKIYLPRLKFGCPQKCMSLAMSKC